MIAVAGDDGRGRRSLGASTWPEVDATAPIVVVPLGSCEQHGPHLPLDTDTLVAVALADALVAGVGDLEGVPLLVAPPLAVTASGEHAGFPGTLSIGTTALELVLVELVRSADWARGVVFVNGHGGNVVPLRAAVERCGAEGRRALAWWPAVPGGDAHAGRTETSLLLAIAPERVRLGSAAAGHTGDLREVLPALRRDGVRAVSPNGVLGDPAGASADEGRQLLDSLVADLAVRVRRWWGLEDEPGDGRHDGTGTAP